jgi:hypothetical protein
MADLDFTGTIMPPPGSGAIPLSEEEKMLIARWIDLGAPGEHADPQYARYGWFSDELKPTLFTSTPRVAYRSSGSAYLHFRFSAHDHYSGIDAARTSVTANFAIAGRPPGSELRDLFQTGPDGVQELVVEFRALPLPVATRAAFDVRVADGQGNLTERSVSFRMSR